MRQLKGYQLWLGHVGDARDLRNLLSVGILAVVDVAINEPPAVFNREMVYCRFPLLDGAGNPRWIVRAAVDCISGFLQAGTPTLLYCSAGMSRSPIIAAAALARYRATTLAEELAMILSCGPADISPALLSEVQAVFA